MKRAFVIILDGLGVGELPDAHNYGDEGSNTTANLAKDRGGLKLPNLESMGLGCIVPVKGMTCRDETIQDFSDAAKKYS